MAEQAVTPAAQQLDLLAAPAPLPPYRKRSDTSKAAAESMRASAPDLEFRVLETLRLYGAMTSDEVAAAIGSTPFAIRPRVTELKARGLIVDTGKRRKNASGRSAAVVRLAKRAA